MTTGRSTSLDAADARSKHHQESTPTRQPRTEHEPRHVPCAGSGGGHAARTLRGRIAARSEENQQRGIVFGAGAPLPLPDALPGSAHRCLSAGVPDRRQAGQAQTRHRPAGRYPGHPDRTYPRRVAADPRRADQAAADHQLPASTASASRVPRWSIDGDNLVITVPGNDGNEARNLGQTARLYIRPVIAAHPAQAQAQRGQARGPPGRARRAPGGPAPPGGPRRAPPPGAGAACRLPLTGAGARPARHRQPRPYPAGRRRAGHRRRRSPAAPPPGTGTSWAHRLRRPAPEPDPQPGPPPARRIRKRPRPAHPDEKALRQSTDQSIQMLALQLQATRCNDEDVLAGNDDPNLPLVTCSQDHKYGLPAGQVDHQWRPDQGAPLPDSTSSSGEYVVDLEFKERGAPTSGPTSPPPTSARRPRSRSTRRWSAPRRSSEAIPGGRTQISGNVHPDSAPRPRQRAQVRLAAAVVRVVRGRNRLGDTGIDVAAGRADRRCDRTRRWCCSTRCCTTACSAC